MNTKKSLALEYFPEYSERPKSAVQHLMRWVWRNRELSTKLLELGPGFKFRRSLTCKQVMLIKEYLGDP